MRSRRPWPSPSKRAPPFARLGTSRASLGIGLPSASGITSQSPVSASTLLRLLQPFGTPQNRLEGNASWVAVSISTRLPPAGAVWDIGAVGFAGAEAGIEVVG